MVLRRKQSTTSMDLDSTLSSDKAGSCLSLRDRTKESFKIFYNKIPIDYANCLSTSDGLDVYRILKIYGHSMGKKKEGSTSKVEAFNNVLRQRLARLIRRTCAFSKSLEMHEIVIRWFIQQYNEDILSVGL